MKKWCVPLSDLDFGSAERAAVQQVLEGRWLTMGIVTERLEEQFAQMVGVSHAVAVANGTAALHLAILALGIGPGDEVILPSLTFVATANAVKYAGATPVFVDITSTEDFGVSPSSIAAAIGPRTKAIMVMHYAGYPCDMAFIQDIASRHNLSLVEDAAHAPGASLGGKMAGALSDVACFSFFSNKNIATGEGGVITTDRSDLAEKIRLMRSHGMTSPTWDRHLGRACSYDVTALGYNYRIDELRSALGLVQLEKLETNNARRRDLSVSYRALLSGIDGLSVPYAAHWGVSSAHLFPVLLGPELDRKRVIDSLREQGIQASVHYPPVHRFSYHGAQEVVADLSLTEDIGARELTLPLYPTMAERQVEQVVEAVRTAVRASAKNVTTQHPR